MTRRQNESPTRKRGKGRPLADAAGFQGELTPPQIARLLGFVVKSIEPGHAVFKMEADERHHNPMGRLHGGVYCDLADAAMGYAYAATMRPSQCWLARRHEFTG